MQSHYNCKHDWHQFHTEEEQKVAAEYARMTGFQKSAHAEADVVSIGSSEKSIKDSEFQLNDDNNEVLLLDEVILVGDRRGKALFYTILT